MFVQQHTSCTDDTQACQEEYIEGVGFQAFRRPLIADEVAAFVKLFQDALDEGDDFFMGAELVFRAMLQSPQFLFRLEQQEGGDGELKDVTGYEMASRLSYLIWLTSPDDALYAAAAAGELETEEQILAQVDRMMADPKAREASRRYVRDWLALDNADVLVRDATLYPEFGPSLVTAMKQETMTFFEKQIWEDEVAVLDLFTAKHTYANRELAQFYGFDDVQEGIQRYDLTNHPERVGFLTHAGILAVSGKADEPSMVERGLFVMNGIFCDVVTSELDVVPELGPIEPGKTQRYYADERLSEPGCARCHNQFDPYGMPFERFDGIGRYMVEDIHGNALQEDGEFIDSVSGETVGFSSIADFVEKASQTEGARDCMIKKPVQFALGRPLLQTDACMLAGIKTEFDPATATYQQLIRNIALNPYFRVVRDASVDEPEL